MKINQIDLSNVRQNTRNKTFENVGFTSKGFVQNTEFSETASTAVSNIAKVQLTKPHKGAVSLISFKGGNVNQVAHLIAEGAVTKGGGVSTVIGDWIRKWPSFEVAPGVTTQHNYFVPYYGGKVSGSEGNYTVETLMREGQPIFVDGKTEYPLREILRSQISEFSRGKTDNINPVSYKLFEVTQSLPESVLPKGNNSRVFLVQTPKTAAMAKQYADTGYAYLGGNVYENYTEFAKATADLMPKLKAATDGQFDPRSVVVHDYHPNAFFKFAQDRAKAGEDMFQQMNLGYIFHNAGRDGYQGVGVDFMDLFKSIATPEEVDKVIKSKQYRDVLLGINLREPDAGVKLTSFWQGLMPKLFDDKGTLNPSMLPISLGKEGYVKMATVSGKYAEEIGVNPEMSLGLTKHLAKLKQDGNLEGVLNGLFMPNEELQISPTACPLFRQNSFTEGGRAFGARYADGTPIQGFKTFKPAVEGALDIDQVRAVKRVNKINLIERIVGYQTASLPEGVANIELVTGNYGKKAKVTSTMTGETLKALKQAPDDTKLYVSWGRGAFQKSFDELLEGIKKYVNSSADDGKSLFVICGGLGQDNEGKLIQNVVDQLQKDPKLAGRFAYIDGWGPADALASAADVAIFPSRTAPCELTPLEAQIRGALTISSNTGGLSQTTIDIAENADLATGIKTTSGYYTVDLSKAMSGADKRETAVALQKIFNTAKEEIEADFALKSKLHTVASKTGKTYDSVLSEAIIDRYPDYGKVLRAYRDDIMSDEVAQAIKRFSEITDTKQIDKMRRNALTKLMDWDNNADVNGDVSAFRKYARHFFGDFNPDQVPPKAPEWSFIDRSFLEKLECLETPVTTGLTDAVKENPITAGGLTDATSQAAEGLNGRKILDQGEELAEQGAKKLGNIPFKGKIGIAAAAAVALAGGAYLLYKNKKAGKDKNEAQAQPAIQPVIAQPQPALQTVSAQAQPATQQATINNNLMNNFVKSL